MQLRNLFSAVPSRFMRDLRRLVANHRWAVNDDGDLLLGHARISGVYDTWAPDGLGWVQTKNLLTTEGCNYLLSAGIGNGTAYGTFYVAPFSGNVAVADTLTAATFATTQSELTNTHYSETTRVTYVESTPASKSLNNTASPATITAATDNVSIWGIGLLSTSTKSATTGVLLSAAKYSTVRTLVTTSDTIGIKYTLTLANSA
jgi:hypothetical protein